MYVNRKGTKLGIHAQRKIDELFRDVEAAEAQGTPFPTVKMTQSQPDLAVIKERSPETLVLSRVINPMDGLEGIGEIDDSDVPDWAARAMEPTFRHYDLNPGLEKVVDMQELFNEADPPSEHGYYMMGRVMKECIRLGRERLPDLSWVIGSFNMGTPEWNEMVAFLDSGVLDGARQAGDVVMGFHEGVRSAADPIDLWHGDLIPGAPQVPPHGGALFGRVAYFAMAAGSDMVPAVITEAYLYGYDNHDEFVRRVQWVDSLYAQMWYVYSFLPFTYSATQQWLHQDYTPAYPAAVQYLPSVRTRQNAVPQLIVPGVAREDYNRTYVLWHRDIPKTWPIEARDVAHDHGHRYTSGFSADDSGIGNVLDAEGRIKALEDRRVIAVNPAMWGDDPHGEGFGLSGFLAHNYGITNYVPLQATSKEDAAIKILNVLNGQNVGYDYYDSPVGTEEERRSQFVWPGGWVDVNPIGNWYEIREGVWNYHTGSDLNLNTPSWDSDKHKPVYAVSAGVVIFAEWAPVWGNVIVIRHYDGSHSRYAHVIDMQVREGQIVQRGEQIARIGQDASGGPFHLHFDISTNGRLEDAPLDWPGTDRTRVFRDYVDPRLHILNNRPPVSGSPTARSSTLVVVEDTPGVARIDYSRTYVLWHREAPKTWVKETRRLTYDEGHRYTSGFSADDSGIGNVIDQGMILPLDTRRVIAVHPEMWGDDPHGEGHGLKGWFEYHYPGVEYVPVDGGTSQDIAKLVLAVLEGDPPPGPDPDPDPSGDYTGPPVEQFVMMLDQPASDWRWPTAGVAVFDDTELTPKFHTDGQNADWYARYRSPHFNLVRVLIDPTFTGGHPPGSEGLARAMYEEKVNEIGRFYNRGARDFELFNEPNIEGMNIRWRSGTEFGAVFREVSRLLVERFADIRLWYPGLSPGFGAQHVFINASKAAGAFDHVWGVCAHVYTGETSGDPDAIARSMLTEILDFQRRHALDNQLVVSELSVNRPAPATFKRDVYKVVYRIVGDVPGIRAVVVFTSDWHPSPDANQEGWYASGLHKIW